MGSKAIVFLGLLVVMLLLVSSEVAARDLVEETSKVTEAEPTQDGRCRYYCKYRCCRYGCCRYGCCRYAGEAVNADFNEAETHN